MNYAIFSGCPSDHVNKIIEYTHGSVLPGLVVDCDYGSWSYFINTCSNWYCWKDNEPVGSIETTLFGNGRGRVDFGNCWTTGVVRLFLNGTEIASASSNSPSNVVEFDFTSGQTLKLVEESIGIIQFNHFEVLSCST